MVFKVLVSSKQDHRLCYFAKCGLDQWHGEFSDSHDFVVVTTHSQAILWRYSLGKGVSESHKPLKIRLPYPSEDLHLPLPLGVVVPGSGAGDLALLIVMPVSGRITYWENAASAAHVDLARQKQQGIHGIIPGRLSGEIITKVTAAEPDGFVLTCNTGRVAHLAVSDAQGKPHISVQYLRGSATSGGGIFAGLKSVFGSSGWRRDVAAVKIGVSRVKGQRDCVVATTKGSFQIWDLIRHGTKSVSGEVDAKTVMCESLKTVGAEVDRQDDGAFEVLDFAIMPTKAKGKELMRSSDKDTYKLLVFATLLGAASVRYALLGLTIRNGSADVNVVHPISCYTTLYSIDSLWRPQIFLPEPAETAFLVFDKSVVLFSLAEVEDTPSSQLQIEAHTLPDPFQDTIDFRKDKKYYVVGCREEVPYRGSTEASCAILVHGFGMVRVTALPARDGQSMLERTAVTAKMKIEQAVFFGSIANNLLDFSGRPEISFRDEEAEAAALEISDSIMKSTSTYIPAMLPSMEHQLQLRSNALNDLIRYLNQCQVQLTRLARWELLWSAEKMAAAKAIWQSYNAALKTRGQDKNLLAELFEMMHEEFKVENRPDFGETDPVRQYFIHDIWRIDLVVPWAENAVEELYTDGIQDPIRQAKLISEAMDVQLAALETAFNFREENASLYGLDGEDMVEGVLVNGYEGLPEIWTSVVENMAKIKELVDLSREMVINHMDKAGEEGEPEEPLIMKIGQDNPRLIEICCKSYQERFRWLLSRTDEQAKFEGEGLKQAYYEIRKTLIVKLSDLFLVEEAVTLAIKHRDMQALVELVTQGLKDCQDRLHQPGLSDDEEAELERRVLLNKSRLQSYFKKFGGAWANALYTFRISRGELADLLDDEVGQQSFLTEFLRSETSYYKIGWINEIVAERNYQMAADHLIQVQKEETNLWNKKVELSMAKLALLAAEEKKQTPDVHTKSIIKKTDRRLAITNTQESLYDCIRPTFQGAIDETAETDLAIDAFCRGHLKEKPSLRAITAELIKKLVARQALTPEDLMDTLTLVHVDSRLHEEDFAAHRFFHALSLSRLAGHDRSDPGRKDLNEKLIWRRCIIQDNWEAINHTELKGDAEMEAVTGATALFQTLREGFRNGTPPATQSKHTCILTDPTPRSLLPLSFPPCPPLLPPHRRHLPRLPPRLLPLRLRIRLRPHSPRARSRSRRRPSRSRY